MGILHPGSTREISCGIGAPVAAEGNYFRLKTHVIYSFSTLEIHFLLFKKGISSRYLYPHWRVLFDIEPDQTAKAA
jgi:hypothetical protein